MVFRVPQLSRPGCPAHLLFCVFSPASPFSSPPPHRGIRVMFPIAGTQFQPPAASGRTAWFKLTVSAGSCHGRPGLRQKCAEECPGRGQLLTLWWPESRERRKEPGREMNPSRSCPCGLPESSCQTEPLPDAQLTSECFTGGG